MPGWYSRPVWSVADTARALDFYVGKMGFKEAWRYEEGGLLVIVQVDREGCELILSSQWPERTGRGLAFVSLDEGVLDALHAELAGRGVEVKDGRWGYRIAIVSDPDGNQLYFPYPAEEKTDDGSRTAQE